MIVGDVHWMMAESCLVVSSVHSEALLLLSKHLLVGEHVQGGVLVALVHSEASSSHAHSHAHSVSMAR